MSAYIPPPVGGYATMPEYRIWAAMVCRARDSKGTAKEIAISARWLVFTNFLFDLGARPSKQHRLRRYELDKGFIQGNVFWSDRPNLQRKDQPEYRIWERMVVRCAKTGAALCRRWRMSFAAFLADVGYRPSKRHRLVMADKQAGYEPGNLCWRRSAKRKPSFRKQKAGR